MCYLGFSHFVTEYRLREADEFAVSAGSEGKRPYLAHGVEADGRFQKGPGMPVDFLTQEQQSRYGRYASEPSPALLDRDFHLDDADRGLIARCRGNHNRLGFVVQLGTVRFLGTFLDDPSEVPAGVVAYLARQLDVADIGGLKRYAAGVMRRDHVAEIRRRYGYHDFHEGSEPAILSRWLANRAWISAERPSVLFDLATARLVERKILLPGVSTLAGLVAQVRDKAASRLWRTLARALKPRQAACLETLLVADEVSRQSPLERLRRAPTRVSMMGLVEALQRLQEIRALGVSRIDLSAVPPVRVQALARFAAATRAQAIARMPPPRRHATLLAFAKIQETAALDDVVDLLDQLITAMLGRVERAGQQRRLRTLKDLDIAALLLHEACLVLLDPGCADRRVRDAVLARVPRDQLTQAVAQVADLIGTPDDHYFEDLRSRYSQVRRFMPALLEAVEFAATDAGRPATEAFRFLRAIEGQKRPDMSRAPRDLLTPAWQRIVVGPEGRIDRQLYTFCVLERLQDGLRRRDLFVPASRRWGDPHTKLLQGPAWEKVRSRVCRTLGRSLTSGRSPRRGLPEVPPRTGACRLPVALDRRRRPAQEGRYPNHTVRPGPRHRSRVSYRNSLGSYPTQPASAEGRKSVSSGAEKLTESRWS
jgi:hypothetical protein